MFRNFCHERRHFRKFKMEEEILRKVLGKLKKPDIPLYLEKWGSINENEIQQKIKFSAAKGNIITNIAAIYKKHKRRSTQDVGMLDLMYVSENSKKKNWLVSKLKKASGEHTVLTAKMLQSGLSRNLAHFDADVNVLENNEAFWMRVSIQEYKSYIPTHVTYIAHYPHTDTVISSTMSAAYKSYIRRAVLSTLKCVTWEDLPLAGHCVVSLAQLANHQKSLGAYTRFQQNQADSHPLTRKRKRQDSEEGEEHDSRILFEHETNNQSRTEYLTEKFGPNKQPNLEKVLYKTNLRFRGCAVSPKLQALKSKQIYCQVKFEGSSVIEGIKNLSKTGRANANLPKHMVELPTMAKSVITIFEKNPTQRQQGNAPSTPDMGNRSRTFSPTQGDTGT
ncbi:unnamed protein product [Owenia fusiformis]|uniref:Uncharacterized protein n=1 Tax=Owenia fusiformis TaxID=6347 RepID=A0A8J1Y7Y6_OWEFU|nr:unnamed protein product [Owenia fusiformis]